MCFFYRDTVYKLYKTHADKDHFIKGVLAPTIRRKKFVEHDFKLNQHFSRGIYKKVHSVYFNDGKVEVDDYDGNSIHVLFEMDRLDFSQNFHEQLLTGEVNEKDLYQLGYETAKTVDEYLAEVPSDINWYNIAKERMAFLRQFVEWLPDEYSSPVEESKCLDVLDEYLEENRERYEKIKGDQLTVNLDNHDEDIFIKDGKPSFIDLLPPMSCWWYGLPHTNLSNIMVNIEALHSNPAADIVKTGYLKYHKIDSLSEQELAFTRAFSYLISVAHFGSLPDKAEVTQKYIKQLKNIPNWF